MDNNICKCLRWLPVLTIFALLGCSEIAEKTTFTGYVEAELIYIAAPQSGWITQSGVTAGQRVSPGELVFTLEQERQLAQVSEASFRLKQAQAQERDATKGARNEEIDALLAQKKEAEAALELANRRSILPQRGIRECRRTGAGNFARARFKGEILRGPGQIESIQGR